MIPITIILRTVLPLRHSDNILNLKELSDQAKMLFDPASERSYRSSIGRGRCQKQVPQGSPSAAALRLCSRGGAAEAAHPGVNSDASRI
jgi:hypothetical protein